MRIIAGILMIVGGVLAATLMRAIFGQTGFLGWLVGFALIFGGITVMRKKH